MKIKRMDITKLDKSACSRVPCVKCNAPFNADRGYIWYNAENGNRVCYSCAETVYKVRQEKFTRQTKLRNLQKKFNNTFCREFCINCMSKYDADRDYIWINEDGGHVCYECAEATVLYRQQYGFWLRGLMSEHFIPCEQCQDKLHEMMMTMTVAFYTQDCITIETLKKKGKLEWQFLLNFLTCGCLSEKEVFKPCEECQEKLQTLWETKNLHIGSEIKPAVELWRTSHLIV